MIEHSQLLYNINCDFPERRNIPILLYLALQLPHCDKYITKDYQK